MEQYKSLRQICNNLRISRRAIQGYEKAGLIVPSSRNKYGHLLYDEETVKRIALIHFYQKTGLSVKEISELSKMDNVQMSKILARQLSNLSNKKKELTALEQQLEKIIELLNAQDVHNHVNTFYEIIKEEL